MSNDHDFDGTGDIGRLAHKFLNNTATEEEAAALHQWFEQADKSESEVIITPSYTDIDALGKDLYKDTLTELHIRKKDVEIKKIKRSYHAILIAASLLFVVAGASLFVIFHAGNTTATVQTIKIPRPTHQHNMYSKDEVVLTLANHQQIILDNTKNGEVTQQGNIKVIKKDNQLSYVFTPDERRGVNVEYNTISTPRGRQYTLVLPDGTIAVLDAFSSINFPTSFRGSERKVTVNGQVYLEVAPDRRKPFFVEASGMKIEVLGTSFNVNTYEEERRNITLLTGSVRISDHGSPGAGTLVPGQQARLNKSGSIKILNNVDLEEVMAWKNGAFQFNDVNLKEVLVQLSRWYDVDIEMQTSGTERVFTGRISRGTRLDQVLEILKLSHVNFLLEGKKLTILP